MDFSSIQQLWHTVVSWNAQNAQFVDVSILCAVVWGCLRMALDLVEPKWYVRLNSNAWKRNLVIGAIIGLCFKFLTIPSCALSAWMTPPEDDVAGIHPSMNPFQQTCWASRGTVTLLEILYYSHSRELLIHHSCILIGMSIIGYYNGPHRGFDLSLGSLLSEIPNSLFMILKGLGILSDYPTLDWFLPVCSAVTGFVFRVPAIILGMAMVPTTGLRGGPANVLHIGYLFYLAYVLNLTWRRLKRGSVWQTTEEGNFCIRISSKTVVSSTTFYVGLATLFSQVSALALYSYFAAPTTKSHLIDMTWVSMPLMLSVVSALRLLASLQPYWLQLQGRSWTHKANSFRATVKLPSLSRIGGLVFFSWILYIAVLATLGETPAAHNQGLSPKDIVARQPAFCGLVLSAEFWISTIATCLLAAFGMHSVQETIESAEGLVPSEKSEEWAKQ